MISNVLSSIPHRWRLVLLSLVVIIICGQLWLYVEHQHTGLLDHPIHTRDNADERTASLMNHTPSLTRPIEGYDEFQSQLPRIQHNFEDHTPLDDRFTKLQANRRNAIKEAFLHAWTGYRQYALGHDELKPVSKGFKDPFGGWGASLVDGLSTLLVMKLQEEFEEALPEIEKLDFQVDGQISVFESTIRYLGGLLSAYELSDGKYPILLDKAEQLAQTLLPAFDTPSGLPTHEWNPIRKRAPSNVTLIAEIGTLQLEFMTLSLHTGKSIYAEKVQQITDYIDNMSYEHGMYLPGLYPSGIQTNKGHFTDAICSFGAMGDSVYEYFLKQYIMTDGTIPQYGYMYLRSIDSMKHYMLRQLPGTEFLFLPPYDTKNRQPRKAMDHLTCFVPGMLAIGARIFDRPEDLMVARGLLETCVYMYRSSATGLCPESWHASDTEPYNPLLYQLSREQIAKSRDWWYDPLMLQPPTRQDVVTDVRSKPRPNGLVPEDKRYLLRPETLESIYILYRITGDPKYQEYGWEIFQALEKWCKTEAGYASIFNVEMAADREKNQMDSMESFLLAETFKYLYLLFSPPNVISLDKFVLNTEAHPFLRRSVDFPLPFFH